MEINMEMGKGMERMKDIFGHVEDAIRIEFFKQTESEQCRALTWRITLRPIDQTVLKSLAFKYL